ncbi:hypothetical protein C7M84_014568 [Penaeus vannamei]|uniref:Uncharacterized protein n=1 Tax=Penaeus vannamei TaxID=6689 RepID=A0A3R7LZB4_PENVA|nr:hypothetical protein C7M84_014568 [Penaeus vannamei]
MINKSRATECLPLKHAAGVAVVVLPSRLLAFPATTGFHTAVGTAPACPNCPQLFLPVRAAFSLSQLFLPVRAAFSLCTLAPVHNLSSAPLYMTCSHAAQPRPQPRGLVSTTCSHSFGAHTHHLSFPLPRPITLPRRSSSPSIRPAVPSLSTPLVPSPSTARPFPHLQPPRSSPSTARPFPHLRPPSFLYLRPPGVPSPSTSLVPSLRPPRSLTFEPARSLTFKPPGPLTPAVALNSTHRRSSPSTSLRSLTFESAGVLTFRHPRSSTFEPCFLTSNARPFLTFRPPAFLTFDLPRPHFDRPRSSLRPSCVPHPSKPPPFPHFERRPTQLRLSLPPFSSLSTRASFLTFDARPFPHFERRGVSITSTSLVLTFDLLFPFIRTPAVPYQFDRRPDHHFDVASFLPRKRLVSPHSNAAFLTFDRPRDLTFDRSFPHFKRPAFLYLRPARPFPPFDSRSSLRRLVPQPFESPGCPLELRRRRSSRLRLPRSSPSNARFPIRHGAGRSLPSTCRRSVNSTPCSCTFRPPRFLTFDAGRSHRSRPAVPSTVRLPRSPPFDSRSAHLRPAGVPHLDHPRSSLRTARRSHFDRRRFSPSTSLVPSPSTSLVPPLRPPAVPFQLRRPRSLNLRLGSFLTFAARQRSLLTFRPPFSHLRLPGVSSTFRLHRFPTSTARRSLTSTPLRSSTVERPAVPSPSTARPFPHLRPPGRSLTFTRRSSPSTARPFPHLRPPGRSLTFNRPAVPSPSTARSLTFPSPSNPASSTFVLPHLRPPGRSTIHSLSLTATPGRSSLSARPSPPRSSPFDAGQFPHLRRPRSVTSNAARQFPHFDRGRSLNFDRRPFRHIRPRPSSAFDRGPFPHLRRPTVPSPSTARPFPQPRPHAVPHLETAACRSFTFDARPFPPFDRARRSLKLRRSLVLTSTPSSLNIRSPAFPSLRPPSFHHLSLAADVPHASRRPAVPTFSARPFLNLRRPASLLRTARPFLHLRPRRSSPSTPRSLTFDRRGRSLTFAVPRSLTRPGHLRPPGRSSTPSFPTLPPPSFLTSSSRSSPSTARPFPHLRPLVPHFDRPAVPHLSTSLVPHASTSCVPSPSTRRRSHRFDSSFPHCRSTPGLPPPSTPGRSSLRPPAVPQPSKPPSFPTRSARVLLTFRTARRFTHFGTAAVPSAFRRRASSHSTSARSLHLFDRPAFPHRSTCRPFLHVRPPGRSSPSSPGVPCTFDAPSFLHFDRPPFPSHFEPRRSLTFNRRGRSSPSRHARPFPVTFDSPARSSLDRCLLVPHTDRRAFPSPSTARPFPHLRPPSFPHLRTAGG